eukprot:evm.model.scf_789.4 EVM.evm.TU.scf_789.4   scf_789:41473-48034(-)
MKEAEAVPNCDKQFIASALRDDIRIDGRGLLDLRKISFEFPIDGSSATVRLGRTHVLAAVTSVLGAPSQGRPQEGTVHFNVDFSPMASMAFDSNSRRYDDFLIQRLVERNFFFSRSLDLEALCIVAGSTAWNLKVDLHVLDHDGNLTDACCLAALAALSVHRRPEVSVGEGQEASFVVHSPEVRDPLPLTLHHLPIAISFACFENGDVVAADPCLKEEGAMGGVITVVVDPQGHICGVNKTSGIGLSMSQTMRIVRLAVSKGADVARALQEALRAHEIGRVKARVKRKESGDATIQAAGRKATAMKAPLIDHGKGDKIVSSESESDRTDDVASSSNGDGSKDDDM